MSSIETSTAMTAEIPTAKDGLRYRRHGGNETRPLQQHHRVSRKGGLTQSNLEAAFPQQTGRVSKLHVSPFFSMLPRFLQKLIVNVFLFSFLRPRWKERNLILLGSYLYKFVVEGNTDEDDPKGAPVAVDSILECRLTDARDDNILAVAQSSLLSRSDQTVFCIVTFRKQYYFACDSMEDALVWVNALQEAKHECTRRSMGHANRDSYPNQWRYYDSLGKSRLQHKERVRSKVEETSEMEMNRLVGEVGLMSNAHFG
jgi:hypothetical protein